MYWIICMKLSYALFQHIICTCVFAVSYIAMLIRGKYLKKYAPVFVYGTMLLFGYMCIRQIFKISLHQGMDTTYIKVPFVDAMKEKIKQTKIFIRNTYMRNGKLISTH